MRGRGGGIVGWERELAAALRGWLDPRRRRPAGPVRRRAGHRQTRLAQEQVKAVSAAQGGAPEGLLARYVGTTDGQVRIIGLWEAKAHAYLREPVA